MLQQITGDQTKGRRLGFGNVYQRLKIKRTVTRSAVKPTDADKEPSGSTESEDSDDIFMTPHPGPRVLPQSDRPRTRSVTRAS